MTRGVVDGFLFGYFRKWMVVLLGLALVLVFFFYMISSTNGRTSKLKV